MDSTNRQASLLDQFRKQGYFVLQDIFSSDVVAGARGALNRLVDCHAEQLMRSGAIESLLP